MEYVKTQLKRIKKRRDEYNILSQILLSKINVVKNELKKYVSDDGAKYIDDILEKKTIIENNIIKNNITKENITEENITENTVDYDAIYNNSVDNNKKSYIDILYKKLALKTHPDKEDIEAVNDDFCEICSSYKKRDINTLLEYAIKYDITECIVSDFYSEVVIDLEKEYNRVKKELSNLRNSLLYMLIMDMNESRKMVIDYIKMQIENEKLKIKIMVMPETKNQYTDYIKFNK